MYHAPLAPAEAAAVARARPQRVREFAAGRAAARAALAKLGLAAAALPRAADGVPLWPAEAVGSISHCEGYCAAVAARVGDALALGLDVERAAPLPQELLAIVCTPAEISAFRNLPAPPDTDWPMVLFSAKEAFYKAWYPRTRRFLDFLDVELALDAAPDGRQGTFRLAALEPPPDREGVERDGFLGRWLLHDGRIQCAVTLLHP